MRGWIKLFMLLCSWIVLPCISVGNVSIHTQGIWSKERKQPFLRLGIARYFWCMSLFANQFPQSQSATAENRNHFLPSGVPWIYERHGAIYCLARQREKWVCIRTQLYTFDGVENVKGLDCEYSFRGHGEQCIYLPGRPLGGYHLPLFYHLWCILSWGSLASLPSFLLSLRFCRRSEPELSVVDGSASIWPRSSEWVFSLQAFWRQFPGRAMEINHWLKHQIRAEQSVTECV